MKRGIKKGSHQTGRHLAKLTAISDIMKECGKEKLFERNYLPCERDIVSEVTKEIIVTI